MAEAASATISVLCSCGKKLKAPATAVGKKAKCPKCGNVLTVTPPPPPPAEEDSFDALYDLAQEGEQAVAQQQLAPRCPNCMREMMSGAVLCTNCGYDTRTGKSADAKAAAATPAPARAAAAIGTRYDPAAAAAAGAAPKKVVDKMAPQGPFWKGLLFSGGGAAIGAMAWILVAYFTGYWGMLPVLLVAVLAGLGMQRGQEGYSYLGGFTAAAITFVVMILARLAVVVALVVPMMKADAREEATRAAEEQMPDLSMYDYRVVEQLYTEQEKLTPRPAADDDKPAPAARDEEEDEDADQEQEYALSAEEKHEIAVYQAVEKKLKAMPRTQYDAMVKKFDDQEKAARLEHLATEDVLLTVNHIHPDRASSVEYDHAEKAAKEKIAAMTPAQREAEYQRLNARHEAEQKKAREAAQRELAELAAKRGKAGEDADRAARNAAVAIGALAIFFLVFGGIRGGIIMLVALGLAYRTASGSVGD